jgi:hypothetical protein
MQNLLWLFAWHGAAISIAAFWTAPLWTRPERVTRGFVTLNIGQ